METFPLNTSEIKRIGMIGLGKMGLPMTRHLLAKGFEVTGYDVNSESARASEALGAKTAASPAAVAAASELAIVVVGFDSEVEQVLFSDTGLLAGARPGLTVAVASTVAPTFMRALPDRAADRKVKFVDAPLCRGERAADAGTLLVLGGGDPDAFDACRPAFQSFADAISFLGGLGAGQVGKMVNNLILWACTAANHEGLKLGRAMGVDEETLRQALLLSSARNWALETWGQPRKMPWAEKDMMIVLNEADDARLVMPLSGVIKEVIKGIKIERGLEMPRPAKGKS
jgi:3-hydroxyisobutyrate dehydrogenase-like beta-hydroxyacid dehydrogenase